jgi:hypothetical protein
MDADVMLAVLALQEEIVRQHGIWRPYPKGPLILGIFLPAYFLPSMLALRHPRRGRIMAINLLLGWTVIGWVAAMLLAIRPGPEEAAGEEPAAE